MRLDSAVRVTVPRKDARARPQIITSEASLWTAEERHTRPDVRVFAAPAQIPRLLHSRYAIWQGDVVTLLDSLPCEQLFDLVVTSPPYNLGKEYEKRRELDDYIRWQESVIDRIVPRVRDTETSNRLGTRRKV